MKSIWKGAIGFGLVNIPVKLYSATQQSNLELDMVDKRTLSRIHYKRVSEDTGKEVKWEDIGKAYDLNGNYVLLDDEDFKDAAPEKSKIIEITNFVDEDEIDTIYYENSYYVEPESSGMKAYALLRDAIAKSGKVGVAQFVLRSAELLAVLKPYKDILVLSKIRFAEEIRPTTSFKLPAKSSVKPGEMKMALALIDQFSSPFKIAAFKDDYAASLLKLIRAKSKGKKPAVKKMKIVHSKSDDLMGQLKASLGKKKAS